MHTSLLLARARALVGAILHRLFPAPVELAQHSDESLNAQALAASAIGGVKWGFLGRAITESGKFLRLLILAKLLVPEDFGIAGIAIFVIGCIEVFTEPGVNAALIQSSEDVSPALDSAFTIQLTRGVVLCALMQGAASHVAAFFQEPRCTIVIQVISLWLVARGLSSPGMALLAKDLRFKRVFLASLVEAVVSLSTAIAFAILLRNAMAIALSFVITESAKSISSYWLHPFRPRLHFSWPVWSRYASFGRWVLATNVVLFLALSLDGAIIGKLLGPASLGYFSIATRAADLIRINLSETIAQIYFSLFAKLQSRLVALHAVFQKLTKSLMLAATLAAFTIGVVMYVAIHFFMGEKWQPAYLPLIALLAAAILRSVPALATRLFYAVGKPQLSFYTHASSLLVLAASGWPLTKSFGLMGTVFSVFIASGVSFVLAEKIGSSLFRESGNASTAFVKEAGL